MEVENIKLYIDGRRELTDCVTGQLVSCAYLILLSQKYSAIRNLQTAVLLNVRHH